MAGHDGEIISGIAFLQTISLSMATISAANCDCLPFTKTAIMPHLNGHGGYSWRVAEVELGKLGRTKEMSDSHILVVEGRNNGSALSGSLSELGYRVDSACDSPTALQLAERYSYRVVLFDDMISEMEALELHRLIKRRHPDVVGVLMTAAQTAHSANGDDVWRILSKPVDFDELVALIEEIYDEPSSLQVAPARESNGNPGSQGEHALQQQYGTKKRAENFYDRQVLDYLNRSMREFIEQQEMVFIATADASGECDCSFRAGLAGFVRVVGEKTLLYPEYRGNGVLASLGNISENPHIGLTFIDFFQHTIGLHVNGRAKVVENVDLPQIPGLPDTALQDVQLKGGRKPERWVVVDVEEAYIHCSKHIPLLTKQDKSILWGTDDTRLKGGDFFNVGECKNQNKD